MIAVHPGLVMDCAMQSPHVLSRVGSLVDIDKSRRLLPRNGTLAGSIPKKNTVIQIALKRRVEARRIQGFLFEATLGNIGIVDVIGRAHRGSGLSSALRLANGKLWVEWQRALVR